ncbi:hypothetical protein DITRI_Ditri11bG0150500 [Diplodiscus trichospermus]
MFLALSYACKECYGMHGVVEKAMELLREIRLQNLFPDELNKVSIIHSYGEMGQVHAYVVKNGFESFLSVANALINAYSKCDRIDGAFHCFLLVGKPDLVRWNFAISLCTIRKLRI